MLTFSVIPQTLLVTGFQSTVNQAEKPSSPSPTPINHPLTADTFTPSAVKSRAGAGMPYAFNHTLPIREQTYKGALTDFTILFKALDQKTIDKMPNGSRERVIVNSIRAKVETNQLGTLTENELFYIPLAMKKLSEVIFGKSSSSSFFANLDRVFPGHNFAQDTEFLYNIGENYRVMHKKNFQN